MSDHPTPLGGTCSARFESLRELFAAKLASGEDLGASLAVNIDGEMVVDLWGGWADEARVCLGRHGRLAGNYRCGSPHHLRLRDEQDGTGRRYHRTGAGRAGERHRESLGHLQRTAALG